MRFKPPGSSVSRKTRTAQADQISLEEILIPLLAVALPLIFAR
jgi:hypothetical protein